MMSSNNILSPANGEPIIVPSQDVVLGLYYMTSGKRQCQRRPAWLFTRRERGASGPYDAGRWIFTRGSRCESRIYYENRRRHSLVMVHELLKRPSAARCCSELLPNELSFSLVNQDMTKKAISACIQRQCYRKVGLKKTVVLADRLMYTGFHYATRAGISIGVNDMVVPESRNLEFSTRRRSRSEKSRISTPVVSSRTVNAITRWSTSGREPMTRLPRR